MAVPPPSPDPAKSVLRAELRARRGRHVAALGEDGAHRAAQAAASLMRAHVPPGATVSLFMALADELDPAPLLDLLHAQGHRIALPTLLDRTTMQFVGWTPGEPLQTGPMGILQPLPANSECAPDLIITPLLGFDRGGGRIGYGAGHYDRAFQRFPGARRIGFAWSVQEVDSVPLDPWDVPLHAVVTELEFIAL